MTGTLFQQPARGRKRGVALAGKPEAFRKSGRQSRSFRLTARTVRRLTDCAGRET
jgi:hypothetical protein